MSKIGLIISREYRNRVVKKSFLLMTFLTPVLMAALIVVPIWLSTIKDDEEKVVAVVDDTGLYVDLFDGLECEDCVFEVVDEAPELTPNTSIFPEKSQYMAFVIISDDLSVKSDALTIYSQKQFPSSIRKFINAELESYIEEQKLESYNIPKLKEMVRDAKVDVRAKTYKLSEEGVTSSDSDIASIVGILATMLIYMFIFTSGSQVMNSVVQEKVNRIVEVMICSVKPWELMWGKIIAVGLTCLTQMALWAVLTMMIVGVAMGVMGIDMSELQGGPAMGMAVQDMSSVAKQIDVLNSIDWGFVLVMFLVYFVGGYLLYSSLFAAIGASVDNESDTGQFMMPITIIVLFALYAGMYSAENPDGPLAFWCSMIPFTSPIVMMVRVPFDVPVWQLILSLGLLTITILGTTWLSAKIYRVGILMYGKKPTLKEIVKWIKYN